MHPEQDAEILERFRAQLARRLLDPSVSEWEVACDRLLADLVANGYVLMWERDGTFYFKTTERFEQLAL